MPWNDNLSPEQETAASHTGADARLLAGPGTGKTLCLTRRIVYLITEEGVPARSVLALTFTRAATAELRGRIANELGPDAEQPLVSTLHSFALRTILRRFAGERLPQPLRIADDYEERFIIQEELKAILSLERISQVRDLLSELSADWERLTAEQPDWERRFPNPAFLGAWREHREIYGYILRSELVYQLKHAIDEGEIELGDEIQHLFVDEYQDLNPCDLAVVDRFHATPVELYVAGDDDQSIYGFRYANPEGIRRFPNDYMPSESLALVECHRCDTRILDLALYVARQDPRRIDKALQPGDDAQPGEVHLLRFPRQSSEAQGIADICRWLIDEQDTDPQDILVLVRSDRNRIFSNPIREALAAQGIEASTVANPLEPLDEVDGRHFLCLLRVIHNPSDHLAWRTLLAIRNNSVGATTIGAIYDHARNNGVRFFDALSAAVQNPDILPRRNAWLAQEFRDINDIIEAIDTDKCEDLSALVSDLANQHIDDAALRDEIVALFARVLSNENITNLEQLLRAINVSLENAEQETEEGRVNIMTMHQAKGLSADAVFVVAAEDEYIPGRAQADGIGDERRLLYVSLTRARHFLYITHCRNRTGPQRHSGRTSGRTQRHLTQFLSGGPLPSVPGPAYVRNL